MGRAKQNSCLYKPEGAGTGLLFKNKLGIGDGDCDKVIAKNVEYLGCSKIFLC